MNIYLDFNMDKLIDLIAKNKIDSTFLTVVSGVLVYVIGRYIKNFIIEPKLNYNKLISEIEYSISLYSNLLHSPLIYGKDVDISIRNKYEQASDKLRDLGSKVAGFIAILPKNEKKKRDELNEIKGYLIGLSNGLFAIKNDNGETRKNNIEYIENIKTILQIK